MSKGNAPVNMEISPIILQFMARSTMEAMLKGDPQCFGANPDGRSLDEIASNMYNKVQKEKKAYEKSIRKDMVLMALGRGTDEWKVACFRALRRNVRETWLPEPDMSFLGSQIDKTPQVEVVASASAAEEQLHPNINDIASRMAGRRRRTGGNRLLAALEEQMRADREAKNAEAGPTEDELREAEEAKRREAELEEARRREAELQKERAQKELQNKQKKIKRAPTKSEEEGSSDDAKAEKEALALQEQARRFQEALRRKKQREIMLRAKGIFEEGGLPDVKAWMELRKKKNCAPLDFSCVEPNPEEKVTLTELPLERTLGQPAVVWRRPQSSFARFYAKAGPKTSRAMFPSSRRPHSP